MAKLNLLYITILLAAISTVYVNTQEESSLKLAGLPDLEQLIRDTFEKIREAIKEGITILGFQIPLDPLKLPIIPLSFNKEGLISGKVLLTDFTLEGLAGFKLYEVTISGLTAKVGLVFRNIHFSTNYKNADVWILDKVHLYGTGDVNLAFQKFDIYVEASITIFPIGIKLSGFDMKLPKTDVKISGLFDDERMSNIISRQATDTLQTLAIEEHDRVNEIVTNLISKLLDNILGKKKLTVEDLEQFKAESDSYFKYNLQSFVEVINSKLVESLGIDKECLSNVEKCSDF